MSGTLTVKELITELLGYDMDDPVFIGLGPDSTPNGRSNILKVSEFSVGITCGFGVYLVPSDHLIEST